MLSRLVLSVGLLLSFSALLQAQNVRRQPAIRQATQPVQIQGTIEGVARGAIAMVEGNSQPWRVAIPLSAKVSVTGTATADFLRSGLYVEFQAELDDRGVVQGKIGELTIVTPSKERPTGLYPAGTAAQGGDQGGFGAGMGGAEKAPSGRSRKKRGVAAGVYRIVGRLIVARGGKLSVQLGRGRARFELTEEPKITIDVSDYSVAGKGDKVLVKGVTMPGRPGLAQARKVEIELSEPLTGVKKRPSAKPPAKHPPRRPKRDTGPPEAADEK